MKLLINTLNNYKASTNLFKSHLMENKKLLFATAVVVSFLTIFSVFSCKSLNDNNSGVNFATEEDDIAKLPDNFELYFYGVGEADSVTNSGAVQLSYSNAVSDLALTLNTFLNEALVFLNRDGIYSNIINETVNNSINQFKLVERKQLESGTYRTLLSFNTSLLPNIIKETGEEYFYSLNSRQIEITEKLNSLINEIQASITTITENTEAGIPSSMELDTLLQIRETSIQKASAMLEDISKELEFINVKEIINAVVTYLNQKYINQSSKV